MKKILLLSVILAGPAFAQGSTTVRGHVRSDGVYVAPHVRTKPHRVSIIHVDGESMAPTLNHGDEIMVSHDDEADQLRDGIYALRLDEVLMVKRVAVGPRRGRFSLLSDNPHYPDWTDVDPALIVIVGRVVWTGSAVR